MRLVAVLVLAVIMAGCGGGDDGAAPAPVVPTPTATSFANVDALQQAAVAAGFECPTWKRDNAVKIAASSGTCGDSAVLSVYATDEALKATVETVARTNLTIRENGTPTRKFLVGPNWIINAPEAEKLVGALGGSLVD